MNCPHGHAPLQIAERLGVEIDYCPECRGVWLDRGELDKILERAERDADPRDRREAPDRRDAPEHRDARHSDRPYDDDDRRRHGHGKQRKSWLGEILDF